jgi:hypothetical protein
MHITWISIDTFKYRSNRLSSMTVCKSHFCFSIWVPHCSPSCSAWSVLYNNSTTHTARAIVIRLFQWSRCNFYQILGHRWLVSKLNRLTSTRSWMTMELAPHDAERCFSTSSSRGTTFTMMSEHKTHLMYTSKRPILRTHNGAINWRWNLCLSSRFAHAEF